VLPRETRQLELKSSSQMQRNVEQKERAFTWVSRALHSDVKSKVKGNNPFYSSPAFLDDFAFDRVPVGPTAFKNLARGMLGYCCARAMASLPLAIFSAESMSDALGHRAS